MQNNLKNLTILYVEDEDMIRQNAIEYLSRICDNVLEAKNGWDGLEVYKNNKPDIIISDIKMPKLDGLEMATKIRKVDKKTPIIIVTAHTETNYLLKAVELQLIKYIIKPITSAKLMEALNIVSNILKSNENNILRISEYEVYDKFNKTLFLKNIPVKLTKFEGLLLELLSKHYQRVVSYEEIENYIWNGEGMSIDALRSLVRGLRLKLENDFIENFSGKGYRLQII